jgi:hypothetical protein
LFDKEKIIKEFVEAAPILDAVIRYVNSSESIDTDDTCDGKQTKMTNSLPYTIIDLACGKGYLSMILSEVLPPSKINRIVLMDKGWPMRNQPVDPKRHINWEHIYGPTPIVDENTATTPTASLVCEEIKSGTATNASTLTSSPPFEPWPIRLDTSKQDLKASRQLSNIHKHYLSDPNHPVIILAIHLCGTLSIKAVELFNGIENTTSDNGNATKRKNNVHLLALKPCCLPGMVHAKRKEQFVLGDHKFDAAEVCTHGKWKKNKWVGGPPRSHLKDRFQIWSHHLYRGIRSSSVSTSAADEKINPSPDRSDDPDYVAKLHARVMVQNDGGFQNDFLFAERRHLACSSPYSSSSSSMWQTLHDRTVVIESNISLPITITTSSSS